MEQPPPPPAPHPVDGSQVSCKQCGYDLAGLPETGNCPECGLSVEQSYKSNLLENSSPAYLKSLHFGVFLVLTAIIVQILLGIAGFVIALGALSAGVGIVAIQQVLGIVGFVVSIALLYGWWLFSEQDPAYTGRIDGSTARKVLRITLAVQVLFVLASTAMNFVPGVLTGTAGVGVLGVAGILGIASFAIWIVGFFASMLYLRWLTPRIPNWKAYKRAKMLMWLGPLLYTVGLLLLGLGPLIALILYWNMLDWVRKDLKRIREANPA